ncbi:hypothetical protein Ahy_A07g033734 [Arachis hypogaea]|uniref:FAR1 domain-containing protein n=1 Tax=Arachis hypogaea TaxID=3818 RepID=A0A445CAA2_ARAHY|nr:hypothetical protein Ahy_A07g033734 [Arachis hypogaea]
MTFNTLEEAKKFYKDYSKLASFSTKIQNTNKKGNEIKNQLITCTREEKRKSNISPTEKINLSAGLNCPARIYTHILKDIISKVVLHYSHPCCLNQAEKLKQHRKLSMSVRRTIENNEKSQNQTKQNISIICRSSSGNWNDFLMKYGVGKTSGFQIMVSLLGLTDVVTLEVESRERERIKCCRLLYRHIVCKKILNRSSISSCVYSRKIQESPSTI